MQADRIASIQAWRSPRSAAEAGSRMSVLSYFAKFTPFLRLIGLPIYQAILAEKFIWGREQEIAFNNLKFIISLEIQLHHYDPEQILVVTSDASAVSMNASYFNFNTQTGELTLINSQTKFFQMLSYVIPLCRKNLCHSCSHCLKVNHIYVLIQKRHGACATHQVFNIYRGQKRITANNLMNQFIFLVCPGCQFIMSMVRHFYYLTYYPDSSKVFIWKMIMQYRGKWANLFPRWTSWKLIL